MTATTRARDPHPELRAPALDSDLDARIALAEMAVITRDERVRQRTRVIVQRVKRGAVRHAGSGVAVAVGAGLVTWWLNRRRPGEPPPPPAPPPTEREHFAREAGLSIASLLPLVWPYLPKGLRRTVTPGTASTVLALVAPLVARLFRRKPRAAT